MTGTIGLQLTVLELYERSLVTSVSLKDSLALNRRPKRTVMVQLARQSVSVVACDALVV